MPGSINSSKSHSRVLPLYKAAGQHVRMSLQIAVAHTGQRLDADPVAFSSVDALKHWISRASEIPPELQILLTPGGKHVKLQALLTEVCCMLLSSEQYN
jgi:autophagy-related protein 11